LNKPIDIGTTPRDRFANQYQEIGKIDMPAGYTINPVDHRSGDIEKYHVIFWYRLLKSIYKYPTEFECDLYKNNDEHKTKIKTISVRKIKGEDRQEASDPAASAEIEAGNLIPFYTYWQYLIRLPSGGIVQLCSMEYNTRFRIAQVILPGSSVSHFKEETEKFINKLLAEAQRVGKNLFNPTQEFKKQKSPKQYMLFNLYLSNYLSAKAMLGIADAQEQNLRNERQPIEQHVLTGGMFYCSSIIYLFMAIEGFINLVFEAFSKKEFKDENFNIDRGLTLEQKIRFMPSICKGFNENSDLLLKISLELKKLSEYRNALLHAKIEDSLKCFTFVEDGFYYNYEMETHEDLLFPSHKFYLTMDDVLAFKSRVDAIVQYILQLMDQSTREKTETYILNKLDLSFAVTETGDVEIEGIKET